MKAALKNILPRPLLNTARDMRDIAGLAKIKPRSFHTAPLRSGIDLNAFLNNPAAQEHWMRDQREIAKILGDDNRAGGVNPGDRQAIYKLIFGLAPRSVLEIGTHIGASTLYIAHALQASGNGCVTTVDIQDVNAHDGPWVQAGLAASPLENAKKSGCDKHISFICSPALDFMRESRDKFDLIFLDGDHKAPSVYQEVALALTILNEGGVILLHDYYPSAKALFPDGTIIAGPFRALDRIKQENRDIQVLPLGALPWPTKQGSNMTSLALVMRAD